MTAQNVVCDTCCLINLAVAGNLDELLPASGLMWHIPTRVEAQGVQIRTCPEAADADRHEIELECRISAGTLRRCHLRKSDLNLFLRITAEHGDDADAEALTIAVQRGWFLASDDRPLCKRATLLGVSVITTVEILQRIVPVLRLQPSDIKTLVRRIETLGRWKPRDSDPGAIWWKRHR